MRLEAAFLFDTWYLFGQGIFFIRENSGKLSLSCTCGNHVNHVRTSPKYFEKRKGFSFTILITTKFKLKLNIILTISIDLEVHKRKTVTKESLAQ